MNVRRVLSRIHDNLTRYKMRQNRRHATRGGMRRLGQP
jgi:hypothetical protein